MNESSRFDKALHEFVARTWPLAGAALLLAASGAQAGPVPGNLGSGLGEIVASRVAAENPNSSFAVQRRQTASATANERGEPPVSLAASLIKRDAANRVLVSITLDGRRGYERTRAAIAALPGVSITAEDRGYRAGILEGYVAESSLAALARTPGVMAVHGQLRPSHDIGAVTSQGVAMHRVDQIPQYDGSGITIGLLSDSYNTAGIFLGGAPLTVREAQDIASCDLPGTGNPCGNTQPVVVLQDYGTYPQTDGLDEGRAMAQLVHDIAPKARLGFATAEGGEVNFANNIRALAGVQGLPNSRPGFAAQVIVDDVKYFTEGMFADTVVAQAVDDVAALGVSYFSSAGNTPPTQGYASDFRWVPAAGTTAGSNVNLAGVDPALYAGGFHNFRGDGGLDIAQTITLGTSSAGAARVLQMTLQWDDPYDTTPPVVGALVLQQTGALTASVSSYDVVLANPTAGQAYQVDVRGDSTTAGAGNFDAVVTVIAPDGTTVTTVDTGFSENFSFFTNQVGNYTVRVQGFDGDTGPFTVTINQVSGTQRVTTDVNLLFFRTSNGAFLGSFSENNVASNRPLEQVDAQFPTGNTQVQMVIARGNTPTAPDPAKRVRYVTRNGGTSPSYPTEYFSYSTPITYGHATAAGANGVAAYSPFLPNIPEDFTSTGPVRVVWDRNNSRIPEDRQVRLRPNLAAMDGGNTTFFTSDTSRDLDSDFNFFGTSAAAPTAAAIAALVLQAKGGPGSVTPEQMRTMLQKSTFPHDLDPLNSNGVAVALPNKGKVSVSMSGDNSVTAKADANAFAVTYSGPSSITSITFDGTNANPGQGNVVVPSTPGLVFDVRAATTGQPFLFGPGSVGLTSSQVTATYSNQAGAPSVANEFYRLDLAFAPGAFTGGKTLRFGIGRDAQRSAFTPPAGDTRAANSGDLGGSVVRIPQGTVATGGMTFTGTLADGSAFSGVLANRIGSGYSFLDGFGFINAQSAVNQPLP